MQVIFLEDIPNVARIGEVKEVKTGYARNYLLPKGLAIAATPQELTRLESIRKAGRERSAREMENTQALAERLEGTSVTVNVRAGPQGRLYGAVTNAMLAQELSTLLGMEVNRRDILLEGPIHELGSFEIRVRLHPELITKLTLVVGPLQ
ncbi:MAG: 50S ribosomal protein L9 [Chloroflexi bacterium]|nr:50S ribosomal protein L9 [Chloroflexota bacterium]